MGLINEACHRFEIDDEQFIELLEGYGGDHLKRQILTALGTVIYFLADVQYKIGGSTFVNPGLRQDLPAAEQEDLRLDYEELNESVVVRLGNRTSELLNMPNNLRERFITRMLELSNVHRAEFITRMRRFEVSARADGGPQIGDIMNISRALEEYIGSRFVPPPWRPYLEFGGSDLWKKKDLMEVDDSEEAMARQSALEDDLAEAYRLDSLRRRIVWRLRDGADEARIRAEFEAADAMEAEADRLKLLRWMVALQFLQQSMHEALTEPMQGRLNPG